MGNRIGNFIHEIEAGPDAPQVSALLTALADIDGQRIGSNDQIVIRKAVLGLLTVVGDLEARVAVLEAARRSDQAVTLGP